VTYKIRNIICAVLLAAVALVANLRIAEAQPATPTGANSGSSSSWLAGAQGGYNWQSGALIYGFETDISATDLKSAFGATLVGPNAGDFANATGKVDWYGTLRGRLGVTTGPMLFYGTGGLAYGGVKLNSNFNVLGVLSSAQASETRAGWVAGGGFDYLLSPNLIFNLAYQHVDLGSLSASSTTPVGGIVATQNANVNARFDVVSAGLSWRFSPGGTSGFAGGYAGGHGGGSWGASTSAVYNSQ
jgi:outer membrane immunogenic protein